MLLNGSTSVVPSFLPFACLLGLQLRDDCGGVPDASFGISFVDEVLATFSSVGRGRSTVGFVSFGYWPSDGLEVEKKYKAGGWFERQQGIDHMAVRLKPKVAFLVLQSHSAVWSTF